MAACVLAVPGRYVEARDALVVAELVVASTDLTEHPHAARAQTHGSLAARTSRTSSRRGASTTCHGEARDLDVAGVTMPRSGASRNRAVRAGCNQPRRLTRGPSRI